MATHGFLLLILVANSMALWDSNFGIRSWSPGRAREVECTGPGVSCISCTSSVFCTGAGATPMELPDCMAGQVCGGVSPAAACIDLAGNEAGNCDCDTIGNSGFLADPYDPSKYFLCIPPEGQLFLTCPEGETFSTEENKCMQETTTTITTTPTSTVTTVESKVSDTDCSTVEVGFHTNDPSCQTYTACYIPTLPGLSLTCDADLVFDTSQLKCVPKCDLAPAPFACEAGTAFGAFPDPTDCSTFHVCSNGVAVTPAAGITCPNGELFEPVSMLCVPSSTDVVCPVVNECWAAYCDACGGPCSETITTTPTPDTTTTYSTDTTTTSTSTSLSSTTSSSTSSTSSSTASSTTTSTTSTPSTSTPSTSTTSTSTTSTTSTSTPSTSTPSTSTPSTSTTSTSTPSTSTTSTSTPSTSTTTSTTSTPDSTTTSSTSTTSPTTTTTSTTSTTTTSTTSTTTPTPTGPPVCNNSPGIYEDPTDSKQFYSCQSNDAGDYEAVLIRCPGNLVFDLSIGYCNV